MAYALDVFEGGLGELLQPGAIQGGGVAPFGPISFPNPAESVSFAPLEPENTINMSYYSGGFLPAGGGQIGGGSLLDSITGLVTNLPSIIGGIRGASVAQPFALPAPITRTVGGAIERGMGAVIKGSEEHPVISAAAGAAATAAGAVMGRRVMMRGRRRPTVTQKPDGTVTVRHHRRMNPCNIHAVRRSIRRLSSFERIARKVLHFTSPSRSHGVAHIKKPRRRKRV